MKQYFNFNGTAKRQEYWAVYIVSILATMVGFAILETGAVGALLGLVLMIATLWAMLATTVRRLRDIEISVWWVLLTLVPYIGFVANIVFGCIGSKTK